MHDIIGRSQPVHSVISVRQEEIHVSLLTLNLLFLLTNVDYLTGNSVRKALNAQITVAQSNTRMMANTRYLTIKF